MKTTALTLVIIGALNWLLIGAFQFDLVAAIFGGQSAEMCIRDRPTTIQSSA